MKLLWTVLLHHARIMKQYLTRFPQDSKSLACGKHHQLSGDIAVRSRQNALKLRHFIELHSTGTPFTMESPLKSWFRQLFYQKMRRTTFDTSKRMVRMRFEEFVHDSHINTFSLELNEESQVEDFHKLDREN